MEEVMKKILCLLLAVMLLTVAGCTEVIDEVNDSVVDSIIPSVGGTMEGEGDLGDYHIKIVSATTAKDYEGKEVLVVTYEWTNNGDEEQMFSTAFTAKAYQNGIECTTAYFVDAVDSEKSLTNIKPGASLEVKEAYALNDNSDVEIEVTEWISFNDDKVVKTFKFE